MTMINSEEIPIPILLNCWKHHKGFITSAINDAVLQGEYILKSITSHLLLIGGSQIDLYLGSLTPKEIAEYIIDELKSKSLFERELYKKWILSTKKEFRLLKLQDNSIWTLRIGKDKERYIHIHPARYSPETIRVRATTLKTAIISLIWSKIFDTEPYNIININKVRKDYLSEPPIKSAARSTLLVKLINHLNTKES